VAEGAERRAAGDPLFYSRTCLILGGYASRGRKQKLLEGQGPPALVAAASASAPTAPLPLAGGRRGSAARHRRQTTEVDLFHPNSSSAGGSYSDRRIGRIRRSPKVRSPETIAAIKSPDPRRVPSSTPVLAPVRLDAPPPIVEISRGPYYVIRRRPRHCPHAGLTFSTTRRCCSDIIPVV